MRTATSDPNTSAGPLWAAFIPPVVLGAVTAAVLIGGLVGWHPLWPTGDATLSEAVALNDVATFRALLADGADPNARYRVRADLLQSHAVELTPLEAAVTTRSAEVVQELLSRGAVVDEAQRRRLACFAHAQNATELVPIFSGEEPLNCAAVPLPW